mmetsp:Transcript_922/g.1518  ORF Transcript_922/g.1518 Transcript_922/m.1518 type:complete len:467 (-) Transcript_922:212-1612(-)|eukprot:CAMPEP_0119011232 /NCGR_PEP_ID=MMETSP1176-20130426/5542_1 /TAXON_ID=265551 /ORGANISM="Synedropsis recta cf, Strain CCMP1620" /LENGTH=466 /DNA_ID=CAMNT_0006964025 /DNA_START=102 /DNA_END=1502 /DNA_ORIENTATION=-
MKLTLAAFLLLSGQATSFTQPLPAFRRTASTTCLSNSIGDEPPDKPPPQGPMGDFLDGFGKEESENMKKAREYMSDESLPISFSEESNEGVAPLNGDEEEDESAVEPVLEDELDIEEEQEQPAGEKSALSFPTNGEAAAMPPVQEFFEEPTEEMIRNNPYMKVVSNLTPSDLISKFTNSAHPRVQNAVRSTILGLIGSLPKMAFDTTTITTGQRLASLMFQLQMTGYLFKNAEYRLSLSQSLGSVAPVLGPGGAIAALSGVDNDNDYDFDDDDGIDPLKGKVRGKLKISYDRDDGNDDDSEATTNVQGAAEDSPVELEVDAAAYMSELRTEVSKLRDELSSRRKEKEEAVNKDLLLYIRTLPEQQLRSLTGTISQDVLISMKGLVNVVMAGIGEGQIAADTVTEQSGEAMAQLCMWQLVVGYNLRELEVREEMKNSLLGGNNNKVGAGANGPTEGGADLSGPGAFD